MKLTKLIGALTLFVLILSPIGLAETKDLKEGETLIYEVTPEDILVYEVKDSDEITEDVYLTVKLNEKFSLNQGGTAVVTDYEEMRITNNIFVSYTSDGDNAEIPGSYVDLRFELDLKNGETKTLHTMAKKGETIVFESVVITVVDIEGTTATLLVQEDYDPLPIPDTTLTQDIHELEGELITVSNTKQKQEEIITEIIELLLELLALEK